MDTSEPRVWDALSLAMQRANVHYRIALMNNFGSVPDPRARILRIQLYYKFLDDRTIWDLRLEKTDYNENNFAYYGVMEVRNYAAMILCELAYMPVEPDHRRTEEEWKVIRAKAKQFAVQFAK